MDEQAPSMARGLAYGLTAPRWERHNRGGSEQALLAGMLPFLFEPGAAPREQSSRRQPDSLSFEESLARFGAFRARAANVVRCCDSPWIEIEPATERNKMQLAAAPACFIRVLCRTAPNAPRISERACLESEPMSALATARSHNFSTMASARFPAILFRTSIDTFFAQPPATHRRLCARPIGSIHSGDCAACSEGRRLSGCEACVVR